MAIEITPEMQEAIDAAVEAATTGLKNKNTELLSELKKARKAGEITPEQLAEVEAERDKIASDLAKAHKDLKAANTSAEKATKALEAESGFTKSLLIENGLTSELTKAGVTNPALLKAAQALLRNGVEIAVDGDKRLAKVGDKDLAAHVKEWAASDEGKHFVAAQTNTGGGAGGGTGKGATGKTATRQQFDSMSPAEKSAFSQDGGTLTQ